jgi:5-formyltetrahydrofolate cyclo-ligase
VTNGQRGTVHPSAPSFPSSQDVKTVPIDRQKTEARAQAKHRRDRAAREDSSGAAGAALRDRVLGAVAFPAACAVSAYWPMGSEIDSRPLIEALHARGHAIGLPVTLGRGAALVFRSWEPGLALVSGGFGTQIPGPARPEIRPEVLLVPLLAFDRSGFRLGYGGGFYDRTLAALRAAGAVRAVGLAYAAQEVAKVPHDDRDQGLDWVVTESEAMEIGRRDAARGHPA